MSRIGKSIGAENRLVVASGWRSGGNGRNLLKVPSFFLGYENVLKLWLADFPGSTVVKNLPANAGDTGSIPGPGSSHMPRSN